MNDAEVLAYLLSHAPIDRFYIFVPPGGDALMKYFDSTGRSWNFMEDDDEMAACAVAFLRHSGVKVFDDYSELLKYEQEYSLRSSQLKIRRE